MPIMTDNGLLSNAPADCETSEISVSRARTSTDGLFSPSDPVGKFELA